MPNVKQSIGLLVLKIGLLVAAAILTIVYNYEGNAYFVMSSCFLYLCGALPDLISSWWESYHSTLPKFIKALIAIMASVIVSMGVGITLYFMIVPAKPQVAECLPNWVLYTIVIPSGLFAIIANILMRCLYNSQVSADSEKGDDTNDGPSGGDEGSSIEEESTALDVKPEESGKSDKSSAKLAKGMLGCIWARRASA